MSLTIIFILGVIWGAVISNILFYSRTSKGTIIINKKGPEDTEIINVSIPKINVLYKKRKLILFIKKATEQELYAENRIREMEDGYFGEE